MEEREDGTDCAVAAAAPALMAVHPMECSLVVAVGPELRVFDLKSSFSFFNLLLIFLNINLMLFFFCLQKFVT